MTATLFHHEQLMHAHDDDIRLRSFLLSPSYNFFLLFPPSVLLVPFDKEKVLYRKTSGERGDGPERNKPEEERERKKKET